MTKKCSLCLNLLTEENLSREHIIPNCIGGRRKTRGFICNTCNNNFGQNWEKVLAEQFLWFSLSVGIVRERGESPDLKVKVVDGSELLLRNDGALTLAKPSYSEKQQEDGKIKIQMSVRTEDEARKLAKGVQRKYPNSDLQMALGNMVTEQRYLDQPINVNLQFGGPLAGRSMVKSALALASAYDVDLGLCAKGLAYLKDLDLEAPPPFGLCYAHDLVVNRPTDSIFHCVAVAGIPTVGKILGYVEYFNFARIVIELGDGYTGEAFYHSYSIDPTTGVQSDIQVDFSKVLSDLEKATSANSYDLGEFKQAANYILPIVLKKNFDRERTRVVESAAHFAFQALGVKPGEALDPSRAREFAAIMTEKIMPFLMAHIIRPSLQ
jgi:HNH endonuclease